MGDARPDQKDARRASAYPNALRVLESSELFRQRFSSDLFTGDVWVF